MNPKIKQILADIEAGDKKFALWFDIDDTICQTKEKDYINAVPDKDMIDKINLLHKNGHEIIISTSRGTSREIDMREQINTQLKEWGVQYHRLLIIRRDFFVDDMTLRPDEFLKMIKIPDKGDENVEQPENP